MKKRYLIIAVLIMLLNGCSKLTKENYDQIKSGMLYEEVVDIIGKPKSCSDAMGMSSCKWEEGDAKIVVMFISNQVTVITAEGLK